MINKWMLSVERDSIALEALVAARQFIANGIELGFISMPEAETPDPAHDTLPIIDLAIAQLKATQQQGEPVAVGRVSYIGNGFVRVRLNGAAPLLESPLYAEQPAPVAVVLPFADKVIAKLQRFEACVSDGQDVDTGRHWFDLLTQLELLRRVQRSPAYWEMTKQGQDVLEATRLNSPL